MVSDLEIAQDKTYNLEAWELFLKTKLTTTGT